jgi:hypothetical protein
VTINEVAHDMCISHDSAHEIIQDWLGFYKVRARQDPKQLTAGHKRKCLTTCQCLLNYYRNDGDAFLRCTVTRDEMWIHHYAPESKHQSMEWKHLTSQDKKTQPLARKLMTTDFGMHQGQFWNTTKREAHTKQWNASGPARTSYSNHMPKTIIERCHNDPW